MQRRITTALAAVGAVLAVGAPSTAAQSRCHGYHYKMGQYIHFANAVLPEPSPRDARELVRMEHCMWLPRLGVTARLWREGHETPAGWVIPAYIVMCESSGQNLPPNSAGASGYYQIIPETWASHGGYQFASEAYLASKRGQDIVARRIWDQDGASQWDCA